MMQQCTFVRDTGDDRRSCPRTASEDWNRCPFHLSPEQRRTADITSAELREQFIADIRSSDDDRNRLVGAVFENLDLSSLVIDGDNLGEILFRDLTVKGTLDLSGAVVRHPFVLADSTVGHLSVSDARFELDVGIEDSVLGASAAGTSLTARRATFVEGLDLTSVNIHGNVEFAASTTTGWLDIEDTTIEGRVHFPRADLGMVQIIDTEFADTVEFVDASVVHLIFERTRFDDVVDLSGTSLGTVRSNIAGDATVRLHGATLNGGRLDQPDDGAVLYDLMEATVGDINLDCAPEIFDRYRFYRTAFDGFSFAAYRDVLRANDWRIHEFAGEAETDVEGLEITYLEAKQGATAVSDNENASAFFVREMQYRRGRYAAHFRNNDYTLAHRTTAAVRWVTTGLLGVIAGYGERPQRVLGVASLTILSAALTYPAVGGLDVGGETVTYASDGIGAVVDSIYFSIVTFTTLGLGDIEPSGGFGRVVVGGEALMGAFLTALFVFTLGRRVTR